MGTKTYNNYEDLLTFTRASKGHALRPVSYGSNLVLNGTFGSNTNNWTAGGGADLLSFGKQLRVENPSSANFGYAVQGVATEVGEIYAFSVDFNYIEANGLVRVGTTSGGDQILTKSLGSADEGTHRFKFVATSTTTYIRVGLSVNTANVEARFDNISVREVTFDESDGTLTLFEHPNNVPRVEYDADGNRLGLLVEEARTNLVTYSEDFSDSSWETVGTKVPNSATSPTGENNASLLSVDYLEIRPSVVSGTQYTYSIFVKGLTDFTPQIIVTGTSFPNTQANFDLSDGTVTSTTAEDATIKDCGNGWFRISITETATATDSTSRLRLFCEQAYIWGAQLEEGSFPTSYIKTTGSTATRSADIASIPVADFGYNKAEGTVVCEFNINYEDGGGGFPRVWEIGNNSSSADRINIYIAEGNGNLAGGVNTNGVGVGGTLKTNTGGSVQSNVALGWARNDFGMTDDGDSVIAYSDIDILPTANPRNVFKIGGAANSGTDNISGHIKSIKYYPRKLTNAQLQDLTS